MNELNYCLGCNRLFNEVERFENTNLCKDCFSKSMLPDNKDTDKPIKFGQAKGIDELELIKSLFKENNITFIYFPQRRIHGSMQESLYIGTTLKEIKKAKEILDDNSIILDVCDQDEEYFYIWNPANEKIKNSFVLKFLGYLLLALLIFIFFMLIIKIISNL